MGCVAEIRSCWEATWWKGTLGWRSVTLPGCVEKRTSMACFRAVYRRSCPQGSKGFLPFLPWKLPAGMLEVSVMHTYNYVNEIFDGTLHRVSNWAPPVECVENFSQPGFSAVRNPKQV